MFLDGFTFGKLVHPYDPEEFFEKYFEQTPLVIKRKDREYYRGLLSPKDLDHILFHWPTSLSTVSAEENEGNRSSLGTSTYQSNTQSVLKDLDDGRSIILDSLDNRHPELSKMCAFLEKEHGWIYQANIYITPPSAQGFKTHADDHNVFILQTTGSKKWRVNLAATPFDKRSGDQKKQQIIEDNHLSFVLEQGDLLYIPKEFAHDAIAADTSSVHITLGPHPPTWIGVIGYVLNKLKKALPELEQSVPRNYLNQPPQEVGHLVKKWFEKLANQDTANILQTLFDERQSHFRGLFFGALEQRLSPRQIDLQMEFGKNRWLMMAWQDTGESFQIKTPGKVVDLPILFKEQILYCLSGKTFKGTDIPDMNLEEQEILLGRLRAEGLILEVESH